VENMQRNVPITVRRTVFLMELKICPSSRSCLYASRLNSTGHKNTSPELTARLELKDVAMI
jgi:hypothetical protein